MFNAVVVDKVDGQYQTALRTLDDSSLPEGDVTVAVRYSTLNYKDGSGDYRQRAGGAEIPNGSGD